MRNTLFIGLLLLLTGIDGTANAEPTVSMRLVRSIDESQLGDVMILQEVKQNGCRFYGTLMRKPLPSEAQNKILAFVVGDIGEWWIEVSKAVCMTDGKVLKRTVKYRVNIDPLRSHPVGEYVTATPIQ